MQITKHLLGALFVGFAAVNPCSAVGKLSEDGIEKTRDYCVQAQESGLPMVKTHELCEGLRLHPEEWRSVNMVLDAFLDDLKRLSATQRKAFVQPFVDVADADKVGASGRLKEALLSLDKEAS